MSICKVPKHGVSHYKGA